MDKKTHEKLAECLRVMNNQYEEISKIMNFDVETKEELDMFRDIDRAIHRVKSYFSHKCWQEHDWEDCYINGFICTSWTGDFDKKGNVIRYEEKPNFVPLEELR